MSDTQLQWRNTNILFADVKGYSKLSDIEMKIFSTKVLQLIAIEIKDLAIRDRNSWGDGIVLLSDQIAEICEAALKLRDLFANTRWARWRLPPLDIRISVHHGEYLEGPDPFTNRTVFCGRTVVTAARIEPITPPGCIWMTQEATLMLRNYMNSNPGDSYFAIDDIGPIILAKRYGEINISALRRGKDSPLSNDDIQQIRSGNELRTTTPDPDSQKLSQNCSTISVVVGVVINGKKVALVSRKANTEGLGWMFPSGKRFPNENDQYIISKEVQEEIGIPCEVVEKIGEVEKHPLTGHRCVYFSLMPNSETEIFNGDPTENDSVQWFGIADAMRLMGDSLNQQVAEYLGKHL